MPQRKAARVFPEPVGAQISAFSPAAIRGQPSSCAGVGSSKESSNQPRTGSEKGSSADSGGRFEWVANPPMLRLAGGGPLATREARQPPLTGAASTDRDR